MSYDLHDEPECFCKECQDKKETQDPKGLKDHQIGLLVNAIRDATKPMIPHQCLREVIYRATVQYLEENELRIDKK